ncbi:tobamovirus multiplication protein 1 isoform X1 [Cucumis melo var. makuwa]|uniref:Tobamovirus multiplication protein 1 isoform X1 n=1 Tax=Cucumis melo var. makuwa TaxID=1194695 RepID=A0A5A7ULQ8_CUCMM|nr:tobamovirus multiplication protein 1 isoform X1 [Cucumis melo var. makuwa]
MLGCRPANTTIEFNAELETRKFRLDISYAVCTVNQFMQVPYEDHMKVLILIMIGQSLLLIKVYLRILYFCVGLITWRNEKQGVVARSSIEVEYRTMSLWFVRSSGSRKCCLIFVKTMSSSEFTCGVNKMDGHALHLMIGSSNLGYMIYFIFALVAIIQLWHCWSHVFAFVLMAFPKILFLAAFLLLLSFWYVSNHFLSLLENSKNKPGSSNVDGHRRCCGFPAIHLGSRQKIVIVVVTLVFLLMVAVSILIWIGAGKNPIDSTTVARVYEDFLAITVLLSGGALGFYGFMLFYRLKKVRSEEASSEMKKVGGLAVVCVVCFTSSALVDLLTDIPLSYNWRFKRTNGVEASVILSLYFCMGSLIPSAFLLWIMRELPPPKKIQRQEESRAIAFISHGAADVNPQGWTAVARSKNQDRNFSLRRKNGDE